MPKKKAEPKPWTGVCCSRCYAAKSEKKKCKCRCHGEHHGLGNPSNEKRKRNANMELDEGDIFLTPEQAKPFREQITKKTCPAFCGELVVEEPIRAYPHGDGWKVQGLLGKHWLFIKCPNCGFDISLWKLGVDRDFDPTT